MKVILKWSSQPDETGSSKRKVPRWRRWIVAAVVAMSAFAGLIALPIASPETGAAMADALRSVVGAEPVSALESVIFRVQDMFNSAQYRANGQVQEIAWASPAEATVPVRDMPKHNGSSAGRPAQQLLQPMPTQTAMSATTSNPTSSPVQAITKVIETSVTDALPALDNDWQAFGSASVSGTSVMARGVTQPDPSRPFVRTAIVRMDLHQMQLHLVAGTKEPAFAKGISPFERSGFIPQADVSPGILLAAFNGGFKAEHGSYGMMVNNQIIVPAKEGIATIGFYRDGHVQIGAWGQEITQTQDLVAFRQNCPLLVQQGQVRPNIDNTDLLSWGFTGKNSPSATWRSGLGLSQDGRFLIYVVGKSLTAQTLAVALQQAGAFYGMQLDINGYYTRFATYKPSDATNNAFAMQAELLLKDMRGNALQYLVPYNRDFFYVTALSK